MGAVSILSNITLSSWSESFNCILLTFLHFFVCSSLYTRNCFSCMNFVRINRMSIKISDNFNGINFSFNLYFISLHCFLDASSYLSKSCINACFPDTSISCIFYCFKKLIISRIESNSKSCIYHSTFYMGSKVYFTDIIICNDCVISRIRAIVSCDIV